MALHGATFIAPVPGTTPVGMSATDGRLALAGIFGVTPQLVSGGGIALSGSNMNVTIAQSVFQLADVTNAAATAFLPTDSTVLTPAAGPGTGSRIDIFTIPLKNWENGDGVSQSQPTLVAGTAGTPGVAPATPAGSYKFAQIQVGASVSNAAACTVTVFGNTTYGLMPLNTLSFAALGLGVGPVNQRAYSANELISYRSNGAAWKPWESDWIAYAPTITNVTVGSGTVFGQYKFVGGDIHVEGRFIFGAGSSITGTPTLTHPGSYSVSTNQQNAGYPMGEADVLRPGTSDEPGRVLYSTSTTALLNVVNAAGTYAVFNNVSATVPLTFTTADTIAWKYDFTPA